ncbi:MAG: DNA polymerase III subunit alpha, partial [Lachnospiraceae bacterium]|nr:DNA polymerase III subunit alpha [Lachnospiraceae bacterium]
ELNITLERALQISPDLKNAYETDEQIHHLIDMSLRLEGLPRNTSMHAAGVVICSQPAENFVPLSLGADGSVTTQFTMTTIEELGLLKMDFLGLRTLTVIKNACRLVEKSRGIRLDMDAIDYNDAKVLSYISSGKTEGVFQLESGGMKSFMKELKPQNLEDIIAGISLYRPGPMDFIPKYIAGKNNGSAITYLCPQLEPILSPTYGCIVYQEQVMQIVRDLGGYTLGRSDLVRRAMSKKKQHVMEEERKNFIFGNENEGVPGCISKGISEDVAGKIYDEMMDFAKYAFNKSHAACYAVVSYQTAYLKCYYPVEFMAALMTSVIDNPGKVAEYILVCREMGIEILPPDINESEEDFTVAKPAAPLGGGETPEGAMAALQRMGGAVSGAEPMARAGEHAPAAKGVRGAIRYALTAIKSVGRPVIEAILDDRAEHGKYSNLQDFITRVGSREVNKRAIENFIKSGAFDSLGGTRKQFMSIYVKIMDSVHQDKNNNMAGQMSLFDFVEEDQKQSFEVKLPDVGEYSKDMMLAFEKEVMGIYVSGHPLQEYEDLWNKHATAKTTDFKFTEEEEPKVVDQSMVTIGGIISECKIKYTKTNKIMAFLTVEDLVGSIEVIVFPRDYDKYREKLTEDAKVFIQGRVSLEEEKDGKLIASKITLFHEIPKKLWIKFPTLSDYEAQESGLMNALAESEGNDQVVIYIEDSKLMRRLPPQQAVSADAALVGALEERFGEDNIRVV